VFTRPGPPSPEVTGAFCRVPSPQFSRSPRYSLPDHLCRFRVRAVHQLTRGFSRQHRITEFTSTATHHLSRTCGTDLPMPRATGLHPVIHHRAQLPSCVTPSLDYYSRGRAQPHQATRRWSLRLWALSTTDSPLGADTRVREYQPVVHRLRLSASP
jgi:hypothetical protein